MTTEEKTTLIKKLEALVIFQRECLDNKDWDDYDKAENEIKETEGEIVNCEIEK